MASLRAPRLRPTSDGQIIYPETDGKPLGESDQHITQTLWVLAMLRIYFAAVADVYVAGDLFLYYEEGNPRAVVAPDVMVVRGAGKRQRRTYLLWQERQVPCCVIEVTSPSTRREDLGKKRALYERLGVGEYFLFDPLGEYLDPPLVRFRLAAHGQYIREDGLRLDSQELGLLLSAEDGELRLYEPGTGRRLLNPIEQAEAAEAEREAREAAQRASEAAQRAGETERQARLAAEAEVARLQAELARLRGQG